MFDGPGMPNLETENRQLRAEIDRLRASHQNRLLEVDGMVKQNDVLQAENDRLRREISDLPTNEMLNECVANFARVRAKLSASKRRVEVLERALAFYADPDTYFAVAFDFDPPCGEFREDFSEDETTSDYNRPMPGKRAREALSPESLSPPLAPDDPDQVLGGARDESSR